ncbi:MAG: tetratricopeptide repeat protein [Polynucleobacter sp.]
MIRQKNLILDQVLDLRRKGRQDQAEVMLRKFLIRQPDNLDALYQLALMKTEDAVFNEAYYFITELLTKNPQFAPAYMLLGRIQTGTGSLEEALTSYNKALLLRPQYGEVLFEKALVLERMDRLTLALESYEAALQVFPEQAFIWCNRSGVLFKLHRFEEALISIDQAIKYMPEVAMFYFNRGNTLSELGFFENALIAFDHALKLDPKNADVRNNRANTRMEVGDIDGAIADFQEMIVDMPLDPRGYNGCGLGLLELHDYKNAVLQYEKAVHLKPDFADAKHNRALARLYQGDFALAWIDYDHRCDSGGYRESLRKELRSVELFERLPSWSGPSYTINGSLGIWAEQGIGDQVLFSTMLPELIATGQQFVYEVDSRLLPAYKRAFPKANFVAFNDPPAAVLQSANAALFAGSLPRFFRPSVDSFSQQPHRVLQALPERAAHYRERLGPGFKVALSWHSARAGRIGRSKSVALAEFAPLLAISGVQGVDVQYGDTAAEREALARDHGTSLVHFNEIDYRNDLDEVLAILEACDLLITTSNTTAHLGGALGKPVWLLYPAEHAPFHYWAHRGDHRCLWYPSVEIISDASLTDWKSLILHAAGKLSEMIGGRDKNTGEIAVNRRIKI